MRDARHSEADFLEALKRSEGLLVRVCCTFTDRQPDHMADLYQDIVEALWRHWSSYRGLSARSTWITRVALNTATQQHRLRLRRPRLVPFDEELCSRLAAEAGDSLYDRLNYLIGRLNDDDRKLIFLYLDDFSIKDIALTLHISEAAAKKRIQRAKQRLRKLNETEDE